jgi:hypothetical protein
VIALELAIAALNLGVYGAHVLQPFRLAEGEERARRRWALLAPALLATSLLATLVAVGMRAEEAAAWGLTLPWTGSAAARAISVVVVALAMADIVLAVSWRRFDPAAWRALSALGALALAAHALGAELLRIGYGPWTGTAAILLSAALRTPLALAAAEVAAGAPRRWPLAAAPCLLLMALLWPDALRAAIARDIATLAAAALLLAGARFVPERLRRPAAAAGLVLALLFLARAGELSRTLGTHETVHEFELAR